jgi:Ca2+-transporting ATPase
VAETVARLADAGVRTVMITGDQAATARNVALKLGMLGEGDHIVSGADLSSMSDEELSESAAEITVFGRVSPEDKVRIVQALQAKGEVVGMLGDGVNDAPALRQADIGVAMGSRGTDVAKDVADLVLADDHLETVSVAVEEGRVIFDNIRKFIFYLFSCNVSEVGIVFLASLVALPLPLLPLQLLWLNVVTDVFPALALSVEPGEPDVMSRPPRPQHAAILSPGFLTHLMVYASLITVATLGVFVWGLRFRGQGVEMAVTLSFMTLALAQLLHVFNARSFRPMGLRREIFSNRWLWAALVLSVSLQCAAVYHPALAAVLDTRPLGAMDWAVVIPAAMMPLVVGQLWKVALRWRAQRNIAQVV